MVHLKMTLVVFHAGAGSFSAEDLKRTKQALTRACKESLANGACPISSLVSGISCLEDCPAINAGLGSNLTASETVECDAGIMDAAGGSFAAMSGLKRCRNPIQGAAALLEHARSACSPLLAPMILAGPGADQFCIDAGLEPIANTSLITTTARSQFRKALNRLRRFRDEAGSADNLYENVHGPADTVGGAVFAQSALVSGCSSGGPLLKVSGRMGPAAIPGTAFWAGKRHSNPSIETGSTDRPQSPSENNRCSKSSDPSSAASCCFSQSARFAEICVLCSGSGESIMRSMLARTTLESLQRNCDSANEKSPDEIVQHCFQDLISKCSTGSSFQPEHNYAGILAVVKCSSDSFEITYVHNTEQFVFCYQTSSISKPQLVVSEGHKGSVTIGGQRISVPIVCGRI